MGVTAFNDSTVLCAGVSTQLTAAKSVSYSWSNGDTTQTTTVSQGGSKTYFVINPANGCIAMSAPRNIIIDSSCFVGISGIHESDFFSIAPNPFSDEINIQLSKSFSAESIVSIETMTGAKIKSAVMQPFSKNISLSLKELRKGMYFSAYHQS